jgi:hypothetical protein
MTCRTGSNNPSPPPAFNEEHHSTGHFTDIPAGHLQALKSTLHFDQSADEVVPRPTPTNGRYKIAKTSLDQGPAPGFNPNVPPPERVRRSVESNLKFKNFKVQIQIQISFIFLFLSSFHLTIQWE